MLYFAGQVWFPDSAAKTAAAMEEFGLEGLPLFILANWRGFSGGQRDLFDGVLQAGSLIVEQLRTYQRPVFVYIPCNAELRGGAWVVVDSQINGGQIEMYADPSARGGVLEPEGIVEIKFRTPDLLALMHRIDPVIQQLKAAAAGGAATSATVASGGGSKGGPAGATLAATAAVSGGSAAGSAAPAAAPPVAGRADAGAAIKAREKALLPVYRQVACQFADLHDTPVRMVAKGVLQGIVPWAKARSFFARRLQARLLRDQLAKEVAAVDASIGSLAAQRLAAQWLPAPPAPMAAADGGVGGLQQLEGVHTRYELQQKQDAEFVEWAASPQGQQLLAGRLEQLRSAAAAKAAAALLQGGGGGRSGVLQALKEAAASDAELRQQLKALFG